MRVDLKPHPDTPPGPIASIEVKVERHWKHGIKLTYLLRGDLEAIRFPVRAEAQHVDGLWRTTCFEAFVRDPAAAGYAEFNLAPSTAYAVYGFAGYREGMTGGYCSRATITTATGDACFELTAELDFHRAAHVTAEGPLMVALSAVIEEMGGAKSYWALAHPPGKPDFHHADGFVLELP
ncbi:MAG: DOMON-like domain-containing protein [Hyphomonadaceae bacterium]